MKTCLIVDDSRVIRKVVRQILELSGFMCEEAENGLLALDYCKSTLPDLVLVDWNMPVMSGVEFIRKMRNLPDGKKPIVIFCTIENDLEHINEAVAAGANEYIMKPFDTDIIHSKLDLLGLPVKKE